MGFEPTKGVNPYTLSRRAPSTARPPLQTLQLLNRRKGPDSGSFLLQGGGTLTRRPPRRNRAYAMDFALSIEISYTGQGCDKGGETRALARTLRGLGWILILLGIGFLALDTFTFIQTGSFTPHAAGQVWHNIHGGSLNLMQAMVQRYIHPALWDHVIVPVLLWPAGLVFGIPGLLLLLLVRRPRRHKFF